MLLLAFVLIFLIALGWLEPQLARYRDGQSQRMALEESRESKLEELAVAERELEDHAGREMLRQYIELAASQSEAVRENERRLRVLRTGCGYFDPVCRWAFQDRVAEATKRLVESRRALDETSDLLGRMELRVAILVGRVTELRDQLSELERQIDEKRMLAEATWVGEAIELVEGHVLAAVAIVILITTSPFLFRTIAYYIFAAIAQRLSPIHIDLSSNGRLGHAPDAVSINVILEGNDELLLREDALQSFSSDSNKRTKLLLDVRMPLTSIASGMYLLTSVTAERGAREIATVSVGDDLFARVSRVRVPSGSSLVLKPHALVGIVRERNAELRIRRVWRLLSAHSWLTFQFRYLVFDGPCDVIVRGCRGVRVETLAPSAGRVVNPSMTVGFTANLDYSNQRNETFIPYLLGREPLLNDRFSGDFGTLLYEEAIDPKRTGRSTFSLHGLVDGLLRAAGI